MDKLICIGKNYLSHAGELGDRVPASPIVFFRPPSALLEFSGAKGEVTWDVEGDLHYETELVLRLGPDLRSFSHYTVGLDMTRRELQAEIKKEGWPWEKAKVFKNAAVTAAWRPLVSLDKVLDEDLVLEVNGRVRQNARPRTMRCLPNDIIKDLPKYFPLCAGDLIFTGTPAGVGPITHGDRMRLAIGDLELTLDVKRTSNPKE